MLKVTETQIFGWDAAIRGMRNPMNSWDKSDTKYNGVFFHRLADGAEIAVDAFVGDNATTGHGYIDIVDFIISGCTDVDAK